METGINEGEMCNRNRCKGTVEYMKKHEAIEFCLCNKEEDYICNACSGPLAHCKACDWSEADDYRPVFDDLIITSNDNVDVVTSGGIEFHYPRF